MYAESAEFYESLSSGNWKEAMESNLLHGVVGEPTIEDELSTLTAFRDLCEDSHIERFSRMDFFLLGFRTRTIMSEIARDENYDLMHFALPPSYPYRALQYTLSVMDKKQDSFMEIVSLYHLHCYLKSLTITNYYNIVFPLFLDAAEYNFLCGYRLIRKLFSVATGS